MTWLYQGSSVTGTTPNAKIQARNPTVEITSWTGSVTPSTFQSQKMVTAMPARRIQRAIRENYG